MSILSAGHNLLALTERLDMGTCRLNDLAGLNRRQVQPRLCRLDMGTYRLNDLAGLNRRQVTPEHGSWLNRVEVFFSKLTRQMHREITSG